jgi:hypothetical protein
MNEQNDRQRAPTIRNDEPALAQAVTYRAVNGTSLAEEAAAFTDAGRAQLVALRPFVPRVVEIRSAPPRGG